MRLQVIDPHSRFACHSCGDCCTRPWRVLVEPEKVAAIESYDWGADFPNLTGKKMITVAEVTGSKEHVLTKDEGGACIFFNHETHLCNLHSKLGMEAKPHICQQYPINVSRAPGGDRIYAHFSCPSAQADNGPKLTERAEEITRFLHQADGWKGSEVPLAQGRNISISACTSLADRTADLFAPEQAGDLWDRLGCAIRLMVAAGQAEPDTLEDALRDPNFGGDVPEVELTGYPSLRRSPLTPRTLLGINIWSDLFPEDSVGKKVGLGRRVSMLMKLLQVVQMRGTYPSRLLRINIPLSRLGDEAIVAPIPTKSEDMLRRSIRSRLTARSFAIDDLSMIAGLHAIILDFNAVQFMARALAVQTKQPPTDDMYFEALNCVSAHLTAQRRRFSLVFAGWTLGNLNSPDAAWSSLRLFHPKMAAITDNQTEVAEGSTR